MVKNLPANPGEARDTSLIPGSGRFPGVENGNPLQYCCLENSMDRGAWQDTVYGVAKSQTQLSDWAGKHLFITGGRLNLGNCMKSEILECKTRVQCWASEKHWLRSMTADLSHTLHWILTTNCLSNWFPYCTSPQRWGLEKAMATHSSIFAWRILWTEEPGGLLPTGVAQSDTTGSSSQRWRTWNSQEFFYPSLLSPQDHYQETCLEYPQCHYCWILPAR